MRPSLGTSLVWALATALWVRPASADLGSCPALTVVADEHVQSLWPDLPERIRHTFAGREQLDNCVRVQLLSSDGLIEVEVILADGRSTSRRVQREADVIPTLEALLIVPRQDASAIETAPTVATQTTSAILEQPSTTKRPEHPPVHHAPLRRRSWVAKERDTPDATEYSARQFGIELAAVTSARIGDDMTSVSLGMLTLVEFSSWVFGFQGRANEYEQSLPTTPEASLATLELAVLGGKRIPFETMALDVIAGPALAVEAGSTSETAPADSAEPPPESMPGFVPRLLVASHLTFAPRSVLRGFAGIEGELGPNGDETMTGDHKLPVWMIGLSAGVVVGTR